jgi:hypothetical protein
MFSEITLVCLQNAKNDLIIDILRKIDTLEKLFRERFSSQLQPRKSRHALRCRARAITRLEKTVKM